MRKIKTFNVEEDVYNQLLAMFKQYGIRASLSSFVSVCLKELLLHLQEVQKALRSNPSAKVPMSFVISKMIKGLENKKSIPPMVLMAGHHLDERELLEHQILSKWDDEYEACQRGISVQMYLYLKSGKYVLGPNKQYLIEEKTGKKYSVLPIGKGVLAEIKQG